MSMAEFYIENGIDPTNQASFDSFVDMHTGGHHVGLAFVEPGLTDALGSKSGSKSSVGMALSLDAVRKVAKNCFLREIYFNEKSMVVSFTSSLGDPGDFLRVNVYWSTGTVGTCLSHPTQGPRQLFRRGVDLGLLRTLMLYPRTHTGTGYHKRSRDESGAPAKKRRHGVSRGEDNPNPQKQYGPDPADEETEALAERRQLQVDAGVIAAKIAGLDAVLADYKRRREQKAEEVRKQQAAVKQARVDAEAEKLRQQKQAQNLERQQALSRMRMDRGYYLDYCICKNEDVDQMWDAERCSSIATNGTATIALYDEGGFAWTSGLPTLLHNKLNGRSIKSPRPTLVALGSEGRYFIQFADGKFEWVGSDKMGEKLKSNSSVISVSFGQHFNDYVIVFEHGGFSYSGVPVAVDNILRSNGNKKLLGMALGPNGEYWLNMEHRFWYQGSTVFQNAMKKEDRAVKYVSFGIDDNFLIRYS